MVEDGYKERADVGARIARIARAKSPEESDDVPVAFTPPSVSLAQLTPRSGAGKSIDTVNDDSEQPRMPVARSRPKVTSTSEVPPVRNKSKSPDYARINLQLHNDVVTRLFILARSRGKRYTTLIEEYVMAGLERDKG